MNKIVHQIAFLALVLATLTLSPRANDNIQNPIDCYKRSRWPTKTGFDSTHIGTIFFKPLPEYGQPATVNIDYIAQFDNENGGFIQLRQQTAVISISPQRYYWTQPIKACDTLHAQFTLTPNTIGFFILDFMAYKTGPFDDPFIKQQVEALPTNQLRAVLVIGADGKTFGLNTEFSESYYAPFLGPIPELLKDSIVFFRDPKEENVLTRTLRPDPHRFEYFAIKTVVHLVPDQDGFRKVTYYVSPYHDYPSNVTMKIHDNGEILYKDIISPNTDFANESDTLVFGLKFNALPNKLTRIAVYFSAANPDAGNKNGIYMGESVVRSESALYFYKVRQGVMQFMTNLNPITYLQSEYMNSSPHQGVHKRYEIQKALDPRVAWLKGRINWWDIW